MATSLVTGANRGIGLELCRQLMSRGDQVIAVCRNSSAELVSLAVRVEAGVDVASDADVDGLAKRLNGVNLDLLINNAGMLAHESLEDMSFQSMREQFEVNSLGPLRVITRLLGNLSRGSKVAIITSRMGSIADNSSGSRYGYRMSKAAVNMAGVSLAHDLRGRGIAICLLHPGYVRTAMTGFEGYMDPPESAQGLLARVDALTMEGSGGFWHSQGERLPW